MTKSELLDELIEKEKNCPFYGTGEDACEVGCSYLSVSDVATIVNFCSTKYAECGRYQMLASREAHRRPPGSSIFPPTTTPP